jgi:hypothetical protein
LLLTRTLRVPAVSLLVANLIDAGFTVRAARAVDPELPLLPALPQGWTELLTGLRDGAASLVVAVSMAVALRIDVIVLARVAPLAIVASYGVAGRIIDILYLLAKSATVVFMPKLGDPERREGTVRLGTGMFTGVIATGMAAVAMNGQPLLVAWVGPVADSPVTARVLAVLAIAAVIASGEELAGSMLMLGGRTAWAGALPAAIGSLLNVAISVGGAARYGIWAVSGSSIAGNLVMTSLVWLGARRMLGYGARDVAGIFAPPLAGGLVSLGVAWALVGFARVNVVAAFASCVVAMGAGMLIVALLLRASGVPLRERG